MKCRRLKTDPRFDAITLSDCMTVEEIYGIEDRLKSNKYNFSLVRDMVGKDLTFDFIKEHGFATPLRFLDKTGLGMVLPSPSKFSVNQVCKLVGKDRKIHVQCCITQSTVKMSLENFTKYFKSKHKENIYNVLSLEFSGTELDALVKRPSVVDYIDWIDLAFPSYFKKIKSEKDEFYYPKVQKYCLMSVAGSYTTFHIDFGGTSVWYHVLKGKKIFWLIEPTDENLKKFEAWNSSKDHTVFFGDLVKKCQRVELEAGTTFMIPSGWIHAVYTPVDSLVFGGNFLHSFSIPMQQRIVGIEEKHKVSKEQRFPLLNQLHWFVLERYVHNVDGKSFLNYTGKNRASSDQVASDRNLTRFEVEGLHVLVATLEKSKHVDYVEGIRNLKRLHSTAVKMLRKLNTSDYTPSIPDTPIVGIARLEKIKIKKKTKKPSSTLGVNVVPPRKKRVEPLLRIGKRRSKSVKCRMCAGCSNDCKRPEPKNVSKVTTTNVVVSLKTERKGRKKNNTTTSRKRRHSAANLSRKGVFETKKSDKICKKVAKCENLINHIKIEVDDSVEDVTLYQYQPIGWIVNDIAMETEDEEEQSAPISLRVYAK